MTTREELRNQLHTALEHNEFTFSDREPTDDVSDRLEIHQSKAVDELELIVKFHTNVKLEKLAEAIKLSVQLSSAPNYPKETIRKWIDEALERVKNGI